MGDGHDERSDSVDSGEVYADLRAAFSAVVTACSGEEQERAVPATPAWRVRDVLAHVVGITADLNRGHLGGDRPVEEWTADQVATRSTRPVEAIVAEWAAESPAFEDGLRLFGYEVGSHFVGDLVVHVQDVDAALGRGPTPGPIAVVVALDHYLGFLDEGLRGLGVGRLTVRIIGEGVDEDHVVGDGPAAATLTAPPRELLRTLAGRRSRRQARALDWTGAVDAFVGHLGAYGMPVEDLSDTPGGGEAPR